MREARCPMAVKKRVRVVLASSGRGALASWEGAQATGQSSNGNGPVNRHSEIALVVRRRSVALHMPRGVRLCAAHHEQLDARENRALREVAAMATYCIRQARDAKTDRGPCSRRRHAIWDWRPAVSAIATSEFRNIRVTRGGNIKWDAPVWRGELPSTTTTPLSNPHARVSCEANARCLQAINQLTHRLGREKEKGPPPKKTRWSLIQWNARGFTDDAATELGAWLHLKNQTSAHAERLGG